MNKQSLPIKICLVGLGSPAHYAIWNDLSCETLAGDLRGFFGSEVEVTILRLMTQMGLHDITEQIVKEHPDIIGLSMQPGSLNLADSIVSFLSRHFTVTKFRPLLVLGNQIPTYFPEEIFNRYLEYEKVVIVKGEGELALRGLVEYVRGKFDLKRINNIVYFSKEQKEILHNDWITPSLDDLPYLPALDTCLDVSKRKGNVMVQASRGCPWGNCSFCTRLSFRNYKKWEGFPPKRIAAHLLALLDIGVDEVEFCDDEFFGRGPKEDLSRVEKRIRELIDEISNLPRKITFRIFTKPDILYRPNDPVNNREMITLLKDLKEVGLTRVYLGVESGSPSQQDRYNKILYDGETSIEQCERAISLIRETGLGLDVGFIMFDPDLTLKELRENLNFYRKNDLKANNQWPFRPMVLNKGCLLSKKLLKSRNILGIVDIDHISYKYVFNDINVQYISDIINIVSYPDGPYARLMYALKVLSKEHFAPDKKTFETKLSQDYIERHCEIFLDLLDGLTTVMIDDGEKQTANIYYEVQKAISAINGLISDLGKSIQNGNIVDRDRYLSRQLKEYLKNPLRSSDVAVYIDKNNSITN